MFLKILKITPITGINYILLGKATFIINQL